MRKINKIIIHCADTPTGKYFDIKDIDSWHKERGFNSDGQHSMYCGYHYVIRIDGIVERGRGLNEIGAHCAGLNSNSIGICLIGVDSFTSEQWNSLRNLLKDLKTSYPAVTIHGHREFSTKLCPGFDVQVELKQGKLKNL